MLSRRQFILSTAAVGSGYLLGARPSSAQSGTVSDTRLKLICIEEHISSPALTKAAFPAMLAQAPYFTDWGKDVVDMPQDLTRPQVIAGEESMAKLVDTDEKRLAEMDKHGIDMQMLSYIGLPQLIDGGQALGLIRHANDRLAEKTALHPDRFAGFATLPWQDPQAAVTELQRCADLGFRAVLFNGRPSDDFLDHPRYAPVLAKLNELKIPLFLHPGLPLPQVQQPYYSGFNREVSARLSMFGWGWHNETGIQLIRMILAGSLDRYPDLKIVMGHWGELMPFYAQRLDDSIPLAASGLQRTIVQTLKDQVFFTPSGMMSLPHFEFVRALVGIDNLLFSVDYPYLSLNGARQWLEALPVGQEEKAKFAHKNAERLFRLSL